MTTKNRGAARLRWVSVDGGIVILALVLGIVVMALDGRPTTLEMTARETNVLPVFRHADITELRISALGTKRSEVLLRRDPNDPDLHRFRVGAETDAPLADEAAIGELLSALEFAKWHEAPRPLAAGEPVDFGEPELEIRIEMDAVSLRVLSFGPSASRPNLRYVEVSGRNVDRMVGLVSASFFDKISADVGAFRGRLLLPVSRSRTQRLIVRVGAKAIDLRADGRGFLIEDPGSPLGAEGRLRADRSAVDRVFFQLARSTVEAPADGSSGEAEPVAIEQTSQDGDTYRVEVLGPCPGRADLVVARRTAPSPQAGCIPSSVRSGLIAALGELDSRSLVPLGADEIDHVIVEVPTASGALRRTLDLVREGDHLRLRAPQEREVSLERGNAFLEELVIPAEVEEREPAGPPSSILRIFGHPPGSEETAEFELEIFRPADATSSLVVRRKDDGRLLRLRGERSWLLSPDAGWFEDLELFTFEPENIERLEIEVASTAETLVRTDGDMAFADGRRADPGLLRASLDALARLTAVRWLPEAAPEPKPPHLRARFAVTSDGKTTTHELRVEERVRGGRAARIAGRSGRFVLAQRTVATLARSLADRSLGSLDPARISELRAKTSSVEVSLTRQGRSLVSADGDPSLGPALEEALLGVAPIATARGAKARPGGSEPELVLTGIRELDGAKQPFHFEFHDLTVFEGTTVQTMTVRGSDSVYYVERAAVLGILELL